MKFRLLQIALLLSIPFGSWAQRNCGSVEHHQHLIQAHPEIVNNRRLIEENTQRYEKQQLTDKATGTVYTIPVVVHIVYRAAAENITDAQVQSQIAVLNEDYRLLNADNVNTPSLFAGLKADAQIQFCLAQQDPTGAVTTGITRTITTKTSFGTNDAVKAASTGGKAPWNTASYLNLWVCNIGGGILGYAQFPGGPAATDGVVIDYRYFGRGGSAVAPYDKGRTGTHEIGHWLNLNHIWGDDGTACTGTDNVADTPNQGGENYGCPVFPKSSCSNTSDMFMNYMDYTDDACMYMFSAGQGTRMRSVLATGGARAALANSSGCNTPTGTTCAVPSALSSSSVTQTTATLGWGSVSGAVTYNIQIFNSAGSLLGTFSTPTNSYNATGLTAATTYTFSVQTVCASGSSAYSASGSFTTASSGSTCGVPSTLTTSAINQTSATLSWGTVSGAVTYNVQLYNSANTVLGTFSTTTNNYVATGLTAATAYKFAVQSVCASGSSAYSSTTSFTTLSAGTTCGTPTGLVSSAVTQTTATVSWTAVSGATAYNVQFRPSSATALTSFTTSATSYNLTGLTSGTAYVFQIQSVCTGGNSVASAQSTFTTLTSGTTSYCASKGTSQSDEWIDRVSLSGLTRTSGKDAGYIYYTAASANVTAGSSYSLGYSAAFTSTAFTEYWRVYIDWNQNGVFTDAGEQIISVSSSSSANLSSSITVPTTAKNGTTRMRVIMKYGAYGTSCETFSYGEVEDYNVVVSGGVNRQSQSFVSQNEESAGLELYPNPANDKIVLSKSELGWFDGATVVMVDMKGKTWKKEVLTSPNNDLEKAELSIDYLPNGLYNVIIFSGDSKISKKVLVLHP
jgi:GEVED domain/Pregnancy-associated plasma protein-A/Fibronectin type III domain/Secretion system C-terminal sorting domain